MRELIEATIASAEYIVDGGNHHFILELKWSSYTNWDSATLRFAPHYSLSPEQLQVIEGFCGENAMAYSEVRIITEDQCIIAIGHEKENSYLRLNGDSNKLFNLCDFAPVYRRLQ